MLSQFALATFHKYPRFPKQCIKSKITSLTFLWLADASPNGSLRSNFYFRYKCADGALGSHLIHSGSKLTPAGLSVPRSEADALSVGSKPFYRIYKEYEKYITCVIAGTDSRCTIFWTLDESGKRDVFINNRCENLVGVLKRIPPMMYPEVPGFNPLQGWQNLLFWFSGQGDINPADLGTKYPIFRESNGAPLITADRVSPTSTYFLGPKWFQEDDLISLWEQGKCRSAAFFRRNSKAFQELEHDVGADLTTINKENSLSNEKEITILDENAKLKPMVTFSLDTVDCKNTIEQDVDSEDIPVLIASSEDEDENENFDDTHANHISESSSIVEDKNRSHDRSNGSVSLPYTLITTLTLMFLIHIVFTLESPGHRLKALHCNGPKKLFDLTRVGYCNESIYSAYGEGHIMERSFFYQPIKIQIKSVSCTVQVQISTALCGKLNNINRLLGASQTVSGFKVENAHYMIISPSKCKEANEAGIFNLELGKEVFKIRNTNGIPVDFYLGKSHLSFEDGLAKCTPVQSKVYLNVSHPEVFMGGRVIKASVSVLVNTEDNSYFMTEDTILTAKNEKVSLRDSFTHQNITPFLPSIRDRKSTVLFLFDNDYRKVKQFQFRDHVHKVFQYNSTNATLPDLIKLSIKRIDGDEIVAAIQLGKEPYVVMINLIRVMPREIASGPSLKI